MILETNILSCFQDSEIPLEKKYLISLGKLRHKLSLERKEFENNSQNKTP